MVNHVLPVEGGKIAYRQVLNGHIRSCPGKGRLVGVLTIYHRTRRTFESVAVFRVDLAVLTRAESVDTRA